jgi:hypothetical protein
MLENHLPQSELGAGVNAGSANRFQRAGFFEKWLRLNEAPEEKGRMPDVITII